MTDHADNGPSDDEAFAACEKITAGNNSNLYLAAKTLPKWRYRFFLSTYAAMRVIDDLVDEEFLVKPKGERDQQRAKLIETIDLWERQCVEGTRDGPLSSHFRAALDLTVNKSDLGSWPWTELSASMQHDARETTLQTWDDYLRYCSGATVAPAAIFIYLLGASRNDIGEVRWPIEDNPRYFAEDLAIYCYIVHILRDLAKDAEKSIRLLTIPLDLLAKHGLSKEQLARALKDNDKRVTSLAAGLVSKAKAHQEAGHYRLDEICKLLDIREALALRGLIKIYDRLFAAFVADYPASQLISGDLEDAARAENFGE